MTVVSNKNQIIGSTQTSDFELVYNEEKPSDSIQTGNTLNSEHQSRKYSLDRQLRQASNDSVWCNQIWSTQYYWIKMYGRCDLHLY